MYNRRGNRARYNDFLYILNYDREIFLPFFFNSFSSSSPCPLEVLPALYEPLIYFFRFVCVFSFSSHLLLYWLLGSALSGVEATCIFFLLIVYPPPGIRGYSIPVARMVVSYLSILLLKIEYGSLKGSERASRCLLGSFGAGHASLLALVRVLIRHGERAPTSLVENFFQSK